jgi:hypothetical protein
MQLRAVRILLVDDHMLFRAGKQRCNGAQSRATAPKE